MSLVAVLILLAAHTAPATAQQKAQTVSGTVLDPDGNPLIGATVVVVKGTQGAVTDVKGKFTIKAKPSDSLQISYLGYKTETLNVGSRTNFTVRMEKDSSTDIDEIVVIGYGQVAKKDLTGSVATVKMNDIKDVPVLSVDNALQGRIAGADFMSTTGEPGATTTIRIRGTRSINASNEPLIVVDGVMDAIHDQNKSSIGGTAWYSSAQYLSPLLKPNDTYNPLYYNGQKINTQRALIDLNTYYLERHSNNHAFTLKLEPVKNFTINSTFSYYLYQRHTYRYYPGTLPLKGENEGGEAYRAEWDEHSFSWETTAGYKFEKNGHSFDVLGGFSAYSFASHDFNLSGKGYMDDAILWNNMNAVQDKETYSAGTSYSKKTKTSVYARLNYNWKSRYYLTVTGRYDGASNFAANNKWAFFPSAALKWNISNENFLKDCNWIDDLSLRLSAGLTGNDAISTYRSLATLSSTTGGYLFDGSQPVAFYRSRLDSPDLTWEKTTAYNVAIDWSMFKGRLNITAEAYKSKTTDLLMSLAVAAQTGYTSRWTNIGSTSNKGIELSVESHNIVRPKFHWSTTLTLSHNEQKVDDIGSEDFISAYNSPGNNPYMMYGYVKGYPLNSLWGFKYGGTWKSAEEREENAVTKTYVSPANTDGGPRYYDTNHDGVLSREDLIYQGNADPYLYGGLQNTFYIHGFKLGVYFAYSLGGKIYNYSEIYMAGSQFANQYRYMLNAWHPVRNPNSDIPRAGAKSDAALPSDFMIHDASYLRLKNITLSYTFDLKKKCSWMKDLTLSVSGENLFLWKKYNGFDPDVSSEGTSSTLRRMDLGAYPKPRTIIFSLQLRY